MSRTVCVTTVRTISLTDPEYTRMTDEELVSEFQDSVDNYSLDDWRWDDESSTIEVHKTSDVILGAADE